MWGDEDKKDDKPGDAVDNETPLEVDNKKDLDYAAGDEQQDNKEEKKKDKKQDKDAGSNEKQEEQEEMVGEYRAAPGGKSPPRSATKQQKTPAKATPVTNAGKDAGSASKRSLMASSRGGA